MELINYYFSKLVFTQVDEKDGFVIYGACVASGLGGGRKRYVLLFVPSNYRGARQIRIGDVRWSCLQTRELEGSYRLKSQPWSIPQEGPEYLFQIDHRSDTESIYRCYNLPLLRVSLLHEPRKRTKYQYHNKLLLGAMICLFKCVITFEAPNFNDTEEAIYELI